jgi:hypothetical protein
MYTPPLNIAAPVPTPVHSSVEDTVKVVPGVSVTARVPVDVDAYTIAPPVIVPATLRFPAIPTPPGTISAPVVELVEAVVATRVSALSVEIEKAESLRGIPHGTHIIYNNVC